MEMHKTCEISKLVKVLRRQSTPGMESVSAALAAEAPFSIFLSC